MPSPLFPQHQQPTQPSQVNNLVRQMNQLLQFGGGSVDNVCNMLYRMNPTFRQMADNNLGKTPQQMAQNLGLDFNAIRQMVGK